MKKIIAFLFLCANIGIAQAQKIDAKAGKILDTVAKKYQSNKNTYFKFSYGTGKNGKISKKETGIFYTTPSQYKLKIMGIEQIFDGKKVYNINAEDNEITIARGDMSDMAFSPTNYLNSYKKEYNATHIGSQNINGSSVEKIKLTPIKSNNIKEVNIYINTAKNQLVRIDQISTEDDIAIINIQDYRANQNLNADMFTFKKNNYKNYIITEL